MVRTVRTTLKWILVALVLFLVVAQFVPVDRSNPPSDPRQSLVATLAPPAVVTQAFDRSCRDCHSNDTRWPWYSRLAPVSWLVASDVEEGRSHLNFSEWARLDSRRRSRRLEEVCDEVTGRDMPDWKYVLIHPAARLTPQEITAICDWTKLERAKLPAPSRAR